MLLQLGRSSRRYLHSFGLVWSFQAAAYWESDGMLLNLLQKTLSLHLCCQKKKTKSLELWLGQAVRSLTWKLKIILGNLGPQLHCLLFSVGVRKTFGWFRSKTISLILKNQFVSPVFANSSVYLFRYHKRKPSWWNAITVWWHSNYNPDRVWWRWRSNLEHMQVLISSRRLESVAYF